MSESALAVIILAAGAGTRMKSKTPKVLHNLGGLPLVGHVLRTASQLSPTHTVAVVRHERDRVVEAITALSPGVIIADQDDIPGTGRAVEVGLAALPDDFDGDVVVLSGDVPLLDDQTLSRLIAAHREAAEDMTLLSAIYRDPTGLSLIHI